MSMRYSPVLATLLLLSLCSLVLGGEPSLEDRLAPLAKAHKGKVAIAVKHLDTGVGFTLNGDEAMPTASLIKFPLLIEVYWQVAEGKLKLTDMLTLREADKVPGSGILTYHFSEGATFSLKDCCRLMIAFSDNTATNMVLDKIGIPSTNKRMDGLGCPNTRINAKVFLGAKTSIAPERSKRFGLGSTTANEMIKLLELVHQGKLVSKEACKEMLEHLKKCEDKDCFPRLLPEKTVVAHKTGAVAGIRTDAGIIYTPGGPVAVCVLTEENEDKAYRPDNAGNVLCRRVAREVYDYFGVKSKK
jgi:D-alanyl-D-alanine carboxypeptidase (penicillin-binding protein 5/6)/beta-lactamase class A